MDYSKLRAAANSIRLLTVDAVETSTTGHPGMALGFADVGAALYGEILNHYNKKPDWINRDRFVLSAGHGAMLQYCLLHLAGFGLDKKELMRFRRIGSKTPGHPEYGHTVGVETTTGPLGAGFATAVGMAVAEKKLASRFNTAEYPVIDHFTYVVAGDGCLMEGLSGEAASLAGHLKLGKLIVYYDSNEISIEGSTDITFTEDVCARFRSYGWQTLEGSAHDFDDILSRTKEAREDTSCPTLIKLNSIIGKGAPTMQGNHKVHGAPVGREEILAMKKSLGAPEHEDFYVFPEAIDYFSQKEGLWRKNYEKWEALFDDWGKAHPDWMEELEAFLDYGHEFYSQVQLPHYLVGDFASTRDVSGKVLQAYVKTVPNLIGGSADLGPTTKTELPGASDFSHENPGGRVIRFGVREHAMASIANGITLHRGFRVYTGTLLQFADYMRPAIRLSALMKLPVIYILTHDSIYMGGDGPTHQPVEHLAALRVIPGLRVLRPGDPQEAVEAWKMAIENLSGPTVLSFSRQNLEVYSKHDSSWGENLRRGAYIVKEAEDLATDGKPECILVGSGSEVGLCLKAASLVPEKRIRIISMISRELYLSQEKEFRSSMIPEGVGVYTAEAGVKCGWEAIASGRENIFSIDRFGASGPGDEVARHLGFTAEAFAELIKTGT